MFPIDPMCVKPCERKNARAMMVCRECKHFVVVSQAIVNRLFPQIMPLDTAAKRLRCTRCGAKKGVIEAVHEQGR